MMNALKHIRKNVLRVRQKEFACLIGVAQSTVSRWENGEPTPSLSEMAAIRNLAKERGISWRDSWFFEDPAVEPAEPAE